MNQDKFKAILLALMDVKKECVSLVGADCLFECAEKIYISECISDERVCAPANGRVSGGVNFAMTEPTLAEAQHRAMIARGAVKPASDKQKAFARQLAISFEDNVSSYELSKKISEKTGK